MQTKATVLINFLLVSTFMGGCTEVKEVAGTPISKDYPLLGNVPERPVLPDDEQLEREKEQLLRENRQSRVKCRET